MEIVTLTCVGLFTINQRKSIVNVLLTFCCYNDILNEGWEGRVGGGGWDMEDERERERETEKQ